MTTNRESGVVGLESIAVALACPPSMHASVSALGRHLISRLLYLSCLLTQVAVSDPLDPTPAGVNFAPAANQAEVVGWGDSSSGIDSPPADLKDVISVATDHFGALALTTDGRVVRWGANGSGQVPNSVVPVANIADLVPLPWYGTMSSAAVTYDGALALLGSAGAISVSGIASLSVFETNNIGLWTDGGVAINAFRATVPGLSNIIAVAAGYRHYVALTSHRQVICWGEPQATNVPSGLSNVVAIAAGDGHSLALTTEGRVIAWGSYWHGQTDVPDNLGNVVAIAAGAGHSLALTEDGRIVGWGLNSDGQCTPPSGLSNVVAIAAGRYTSVALRGKPKASAKPRLLGPRLVVATVDRSVWRRIVVANGASTYEAQGLPPGVTVDLASGIISGRPTSSGLYHVTLKAKNSLGVGSSALTLWVNLPLPGMTAGPTAETVLGMNVNIPLGYVNDPDEAQVTGLPPGLTFDAQYGIIAGHPLVRGDFPVAVSLSNSYGTASSAFVVSVKEVVGWGNNAHTQTSIPAGLSNVVAIAGGISHSVVLTAEGTVASWGKYLESRRLYTIETPTALTNVVAIAAGDGHCLALTDQKRIVGWGSGDSGQTRIPSTLSNALAIAAGGAHSLALTGDGRVVGWGNNSAGQCTIPSALSNVLAIAAGGLHSVALTKDGRVFAWGNNGYGQATGPSGLRNVVAVAAGNAHCLALTSDGKVVGWGNNGFGQCDPPTGANNIVGITAAGDHSLALCSDGRVVAWGRNSDGESTAPTGLDTVMAIAAGGTHSLARGTALGEYSAPVILNPAVALGMVDGDWRQQIFVPNVVTGFGAEGLPPGLAVDAETGLITGQPMAEGIYQVMLLATNGVGVTRKPVTFAINLPLPGVSVEGAFSARLGDHFTLPLGYVNDVAWAQASGLPPGLALDPVTGVVSGRPLAAGEFPVSVALSNRFGLGYGGFTIRVAQVVAWGDNTFGKTNVPSVLGNVSAIAAGTYHSVALTTAGGVAAWGYNSKGQTNVPSDLNNVVAIAAGCTDWAHNLALTAEGQVVGWGYNGQGQTKIPTGLSNVVAVAAGGGHSLGLTSDGRVISWGSNYSGQTNVPAGLSNVVAIAAGPIHSLALTTEGQVVAWGDNNFGESNVPIGLSNVIAIAAGVGEGDFSKRSLALTSDGRVIGWGGGGYTQITPSTGLSNVVAIAAGYDHSLALKSDGSIVGWGNGNSGALTIPKRLTNAVAVAAGHDFSMAFICPRPTDGFVFRSQPLAVGANVRLVPRLVGSGSKVTDWLFNGTSLGSGLSGTFEVTDFQGDKAGRYTAVTVFPFATVTNTVIDLSLAADHPPEITAVPDQTVAERQTFALQIQATDPSIPAHPLTFSLDLGAPEGAALSGTGAFTWTPTEGQGPSTNAITVRVSNGVADATMTFQAIVTEVNEPPALTPFANLTVPEGTLCTFTATSTDADLPAQRLTFSLDDGVPDGAVITPDGVFSLTPTEVQGPGTHDITIRVSDGITSASQTFQVVVTEVNSAPTLATLDQTIPELQPFALTLAGTDSDLPAQTLAYVLLAGPDGLTLTGNQLAWTPTEAQGPSTNTVTVKVTDAGEPALSATNMFLIVVNEVNSAPTLAVAGQTIPELQPFALTLAGTDADLPAQALTYALLAGPDGLTLTGNQVLWTPTEAQGPSTNAVTVKVIDNGEPALSATNTFRIIVTEVNSAPTLAIADQTIPEFQPFALTLSGVDSDLPAQTLAYVLLAGPDGLTLTGDQIHWTPTEAQGSSTNTVTLKLTDNGEPALSVTNTFRIIVTEINSAPTLAIAAQTIPELQPFALSLAGTDADLPAQTLTYALLAGPDGLTLAGNQLAWTPTEAQGPSTNTVTLKLTDSGEPALSATNTFRIIVTEINSAPTLAIADQVIEPGQSLQLSLTATDSDLPPQTLTYTLEGPVPSGLSLAGNQLTWTPTEAQRPSTNAITVNVTDDGVLPVTATATFKLLAKAAELVRMDAPSYAQNTFSMNVTIAKDRAFVLESSENLTAWTKLQEGMGTGASQTLTDTPAPQNGRYYRIRMAP